MKNKGLKPWAKSLRTKLIMAAEEFINMLLSGFILVGGWGREYFRRRPRAAMSRPVTIICPIVPELNAN